MADEGNARGSFDSTTPTKDASSSASSESRSTADAVDIMLRCAADDARAAGARETRRETDGLAISDPGLPHLPYLTDTHARGSLVGPDSGLCAPRAHENIPTSPLGSVWLAAGDVCAVAAAVTAAELATGLAGAPAAATRHSSPCPESRRARDGPPRFLQRRHRRRHRGLGLGLPRPSLGPRRRLIGVLLLASPPRLASMHRSQSGPLVPWGA